jgi:hypothetical protein
MFSFPKGYDGAVAAGLFDAQIDDFVTGLLSLDRPAFVRIGFEFNGEWNDYTPSSFGNRHRHQQQQNKRKKKKRKRKRKEAFRKLMCCLHPAPPNLFSSLDSCFLFFSFLFFSLYLSPPPIHRYKAAFARIVARWRQRGCQSVASVWDYSADAEASRLNFTEWMVDDADVDWWAVNIFSNGSAPTTASVGSDLVRTFLLEVFFIKKIIINQRCGVRLG